MKTQITVLSDVRTIRSESDPWKLFIIFLNIVFVHIFSRRDHREWMLCPPPSSFFANRVLEFVPHRFRSGLVDVRCVTKGCTFYLQKKKVHNKSSDLSGGTGFSECEGPQKMRFSRGAPRLAFSKFKRRRCRNAPCRGNTVG